MIAGRWTNHGPVEVKKRAIETQPVKMLPTRDVGAARLFDLIEAWKENRVRLKRKVDPHLVRDMEATVHRFAKLTGAEGYADVNRQDVLRFRDHLLTETTYKIPTVNKKVGYITALIGLAVNKGYIDVDISGGIYIESPDHEGIREPFDANEIAQLFSHPVFTARYQFKVRKALGELQFWLPLISLTSGLITTEILQMGPDSICRHPDSNIWCYQVTTAGSRTIKSYARERYVPIRCELLEGLTSLREIALSSKNVSLWEVMETGELSLNTASNYFSSFWHDFQRHKVGIVAVDKSLYSLRHSFLDGLREVDASNAQQEALMGHAVFGTKRPTELSVILVRRML